MRAAIVLQQPLGRLPAVAGLPPTQTGGFKEKKLKINLFPPSIARKERENKPSPHPSHEFLKFKQYPCRAVAVPLFAGDGPAAGSRRTAAPGVGQSARGASRRHQFIFSGLGITQNAHVSPSQSPSNSSQPSCPAS